MGRIQGIRLRSVTPNREDNAALAQVLGSGSSPKPSYQLVFEVDLALPRPRRPVKDRSSDPPKKMWHEQVWYGGDGRVVMLVQVARKTSVPKEVQEHELAMPLEIRTGLRSLAVMWETGLCAAVDAAGQMTLTITGYSGDEACPFVLADTVRDLLMDQKVLRPPN